MVVGTSGDNGESSFSEFFGKCGGIAPYLHGIFLPFGLQALAESDGLGSNNVLERSALDAWEHCTVEELAHHFSHTFGRLEPPGIFEVLAHKDNSATWSTKGLVSGGGNNVCIFYGIVEQSGCDKSGRMRHIYHEDGTYTVGNGTHTGIVPLSAVG